MAIQGRLHLRTRLYWVTHSCGGPHTPWSSPSCNEVFMIPDIPAHRRRANDVPWSTEARSRRAVKPACLAFSLWAAC